MAAILKDLYSPELIEAIGQATTQLLPSFDSGKLLKGCLTADWPDLKLMERRDRLTAQLHAQLPANFTLAAPIIQQVGQQFTGLAAVVFPNYVATYGLEDWQLSMALLADLTQYSSAEFAIRPFLVRYPEQTSQQMLRWAHSDSAAVRRLASEGIRPRLPWGLRLTQYVDAPTPIMPILTQLIFDDSEYVQKSVANNLNDISKDHPELVIAFAQKYWSQNDRTDWVLKQGLRTLFKQGVPAVLQLQGYDIQAAKLLEPVSLTPTTQTAAMGTTSLLHYQVTAKQPVPVYLGYRVHYVRQNKTDAFKDFFVKRTTLKKGTPLTGDLKIKWRQLTTRRLYSGIHTIELLVNTQVVAQSQVDLTQIE